MTSLSPSIFAYVCSLFHIIYYIIHFTLLHSRSWNFRKNYKTLTCNRNQKKHDPTRALDSLMLVVKLRSKQPCQLIKQLISHDDVPPNNSSHVPSAPNSTELTYSKFSTVTLWQVTTTTTKNQYKLTLQIIRRTKTVKLEPL